MVRLHGTEKFYSLGKRVGQAVKADIVLAFTEEPLYSSKFKKAEFLFGEANRPLETCIVSLAPIREEFYGRTRDDSLLLQRLLKETLHELGHQLLRTMNHCENPTCAMAYAPDVAAVDKKQVNFCPACREKLTQLHATFNL